jgi:hypothetical protein
MRRLSYRFLICVSLANLMFVKAWAMLNSKYIVYQLKAPPAFHWMSTIAAVLVLATVFFVAQELIRRIPWRGNADLLRLGFLLVIFAFLKRFLEINSMLDLSRMPGLLIPIVLLVLWLSKKQRVAAALASVLVALSPYFLINAWFGIQTVAANDSRYQELPNRIHKGNPTTDRRVVWIVFDTLDYHHAFENRPAWLKLPELDRFRAESLDFTNADSPAERTGKSIPSLLTGLVVADELLPSPNDFTLLLPDGKQQSFRQTTTIFGEAEDMGVKTAVLGYYIPYGRLLGDETSYCRWWQWGDYFDSESPWYASLPTQILMTLGKPVSAGDQVSRQIRGHKQEVEEAIKLVGNSDYGLVYTHFFPPHQPAMYNARTGQFDPRMPAKENGYFDSLALVDLTLGQLRREMERAGTWDKTLVIVTSDHSWRYARDFGQPVHRRIPFLLHFPGQTGRLKGDDPINTLLTHDALVAYLKGDVSDPTKFQSWTNTWMKTAPPIPKVTLDPDAGVEQNRG